VNESRARCVFCSLNLFWLGTNETTCDTCVVYRVNKKTARALRQEIFGPERIAELCVNGTYKSSPASESSDTSACTSGNCG